MNRTKKSIGMAVYIVIVYQVNAQTAQTLPFTQDWSNTGLITTNTFGQVYLHVSQDESLLLPQA